MCFFIFFHLQYIPLSLVLNLVPCGQAKALAEKNQRDLQAQREQEERHVSSYAKVHIYYDLLYVWQRQFIGFWKLSCSCP